MQQVLSLTVTAPLTTSSSVLLTSSSYGYLALLTHHPSHHECNELNLRVIRV